MFLLVISACTNSHEEEIDPRCEIGPGQSACIRITDDGAIDRTLYPTTSQLQIWSSSRYNLFFSESESTIDILINTNANVLNEYSGSFTGEVLQADYSFRGRFYTSEMNSSGFITKPEITLMLKSENETFSGRFRFVAYGGTTGQLNQRIVVTGIFESIQLNDSLSSG
jgi:hypothetical protein